MPTRHGAATFLWHGKRGRAAAPPCFKLSWVWNSGAAASWPLPSGQAGGHLCQTPTVAAQRVKTPGGLIAFVRARWRDVVCHPRDLRSGDSLVLCARAHIAQAVVLETVVGLPSTAAALHRRDRANMVRPMLRTWVMPACAGATAFWAGSRRWRW
jgi:hypothetical protein